MSAHPRNNNKIILLQTSNDHFGNLRVIKTLPASSSVTASSSVASEPEY